MPTIEQWLAHLRGSHRDRQIRVARGILRYQLPDLNRGHRVRRRVTSIVGFMFLLSPVALFGQRIGVGIKGTVQFTNLLSREALNPNFTENETRSTVGPSVELSLPKRFMFEATALRKRLSYNNRAGSIRGQGGTIVSNDTTATFWEVPLLLKWRTHEGRVSPLIGAGLSARHVDGHTHFYGISKVLDPLAPITTFDFMREIPQLGEESPVGFVASAGMSIRVRFLHLSPEVRYTRWAGRAFPGLQKFEIVSESPIPHARSKQDQFEVLVGITFSSWRR